MPLPAGTERGGEAGENNKRRAKNAIKSGGAPERGAGVRSAVRVCVCLCFFTPCGRSGCVRAVPGRGGRRVPSLPRAVLRSSLGDAEESLLLRDAPRGARIPARCSPSLRGAPEPRGTSSPEEKKNVIITIKILPLAEKKRAREGRIGSALLQQVREL